MFSPAFVQLKRPNYLKTMYKFKHKTFKGLCLYFLFFLILKMSSPFSSIYRGLIPTSFIGSYYHSLLHSGLKALIQRILWAIFRNEKDWDEHLFCEIQPKSDNSHVMSKQLWQFMYINDQLINVKYL